MSPTDSFTPLSDADKVARLLRALNPQHEYFRHNSPEQAARQAPSQFAFLLGHATRLTIQEFITRRLIDLGQVSHMPELWIVMAACQQYKEYTIQLLAQLPPPQDARRLTEAIELTAHQVLNGQLGLPTLEPNDFTNRIFALLCPEAREEDIQRALISLNTV